MAGNKIGAEGGIASCQYNLGNMFLDGRGIDSPDHERAVAWTEKAAAQHYPPAVAQLALLVGQGSGCYPSFRRSRDLFERALSLGADCERQMQGLAASIKQDAPLMGRRIEIYGLASRQEMNGRCGVATDFHMVGGPNNRVLGLVSDASKWRYSGGGCPNQHLNNGSRFRRRARAQRARNHFAFVSDLGLTPLSVRLDSGEVFKVREQNIRAERGAKGKGKGKGKGKKNRGGNNSRD